MFEHCSRWWYYSYLKKVPSIQDMCYAHAGSVIHNCLEKHYNNEITVQDELKSFFNREWNKYKLDSTKLLYKKDEYWLMIINGINLNKKFTSTELKIFYPDIVGYLDVVNTETDEIADWKSSTRRRENEEEYTKQLKLYSYLYYRKFDRLPKKAIVYYLKYSGDKGELSFTPTMEDVEEIKKWHEDIYTKMHEIKNSMKLPPMCKQCHFFCPYKNLCAGSDKGILKYTLHYYGAKIYLDGPISNLLHIGIDKKFSYELKDAFFIKKHNPHAMTTIKFWNLKKRLLPIGFKDGLVKTLNDYAKYKGLKLALDVEDHRQCDTTIVEMPNELIGKKLRDYQEDAVTTFFRNKIGCLELGTGAGKNLIAAECIRRAGVKTLFIVDKIELLRQTKKVFEDSLGIEIGVIGGGEEDIKDVTVATIQTLIKRVKKYADYLKTVRFLAIDESHHSASRSFFKLSQYLINTEFRVNLTGTYTRDDGNDMMMYAVGGYKIFDLSSKVLIENGWLIKPTIKFIKNFLDPKEIKHLEDNSKEGLINETEQYSLYYKSFIANNSKRNKIIKELCDKNKGKKILVLVKLIDHGKLLEKEIEGSKYLYGETNKKEREEMFKEFTEGKLNVLISTISIFAEGIDIPQLDTVINASANKGNVKTIQVLGRVLRKMEGKTNAQYIDFVDEPRFFRLASLARMKILRQEGHDVQQEVYEG